MFRFVLAFLVASCFLGAQCIVYPPFTTPSQNVSPCGDSTLQNPGFSLYVGASITAPPAGYTQTAPFVCPTAGIQVINWSSPTAQDAIRFNLTYPAAQLQNEGWDLSIYYPGIPVGIPEDNSYAAVYMWPPGATTTPIGSPFGTFANPDMALTVVTQFELQQADFTGGCSSGLPGPSSMRTFNTMFVEPNGLSFAALIGTTWNVQVVFQIGPDTGLAAGLSTLAIGPVQSITIL